MITSIRFRHLRLKTQDSRLGSASLFKIRLLTKSEPRDGENMSAAHRHKRNIIKRIDGLRRRGCDKVTYLWFDIRGRVEALCEVSDC